LCVKWNIISFLCLSFSRHNASESLLNFIGFLFLHLIFIWFFLKIPSLTFYINLVFRFLNFASAQVGLFLFLVFLYFFSFFLTLFLIIFF
jgi:hypothetical protein